MTLRLALIQRALARLTSGVSRFAGEDFRRRSPLLVLGLFRRRGPRPSLGLEVTWYPTSKRHAPPRPPYLNLCAHPGLMDELYVGLTLGRSEA